MQENLDIEYECGKGWYPIINDIVAKINDYNKTKSKEEQVTILQIKEKFGGLRIYVRPKVDEIAKAIENAEVKCSQTCEMCGSTHDVGMSRTSRGWLQTLCNECFKKIKLSKDKDSKFFSNKK